MIRACPETSQECPYFERGCYSDSHHNFWPNPDYTTDIERKFRELPENKEQTCRWEHDQIHEGDPPIKPSVEVMEHAIVSSGVYLNRRLRKRLHG